MTRPQILFVDDEPSVLSGLRRLLWKQREDWDLHWATGGAEALDHLRRSPVDIIVTDMLMPGIDGAALLEQARQLHPATVRLVLSGHADHDTIIAATGPTQQFLSKPCEPTLLVSALNSAVATLGLMQDERLRALIGGQGSLPKPPSIYTELVSLTSRPQTSVAEVCRLIEQDVATSTEVLKLINSSFFGLATDVTSIERAITLLGLDVLKALVLAGSVFRPSMDLPPGFNAPRIAERGLRASGVVGRIGRAEGWDATSCSRLGLAALLHDVGLLVLAGGDHSAWHAYQSADASLPAAARQTEAFGCTVGRASAYLLGLWGFQQIVVSTLAEQPLDLTDALVRGVAAPAALAVAYAHHDDERAPLDPASWSSIPDGSYLTGDRIAMWRSLRD